MLCCEQLEQLQSECADKENLISQLQRQLADNAAKLDCFRQEYGLSVHLTSKTLPHCTLMHNVLYHKLQTAAATLVSHDSKQLFTVLIHLHS